ncbi:MAG: MerR family transcriptional regulator [Planctomycetia bacterium]|nr:MerR family transcriptional regulator [Planctomycetia bacterium]
MKNLMRISKFAELSGIPRKNLIEYDKIGILKPVYSDVENRYRYYSYQQLEIAMLIKIFRELEIPLKEIKMYIEQRSPSKFMELCEEQKKKIEKKIERLYHLNMILEAHMKKTAEGIHVHSQEICQKTWEEERIFPGNPLPPLNEGMDLWNHYYDFLSLCETHHIPPGFPTGIVVCPEKMRDNSQTAAKCFYCKLPADFSCERMTIKPAGLYVVGHDSQSGSFSDQYYKKMFDYVERHFLTVIGDGYEFYLLDELSFLDPHKYLVQISIPVRISSRGDRKNSQA